MKKFILKIISVFVFFFAAVLYAGSESNKVVKDKTVGIEKEYNVVILGGGIGALTSGVYLARANYSPLIIEGDMPGGLITQSHAVENWPGELKISGNDLMEKVKQQALKNGCNFLSKEVIDVDFSKKPFEITIRDIFKKDQIEVIKARSCIIAMGTTSNYLNIEGEKEYWGKGVSNCAICDGSFFQGKKVAIVGGGNAAVVEANYLSNIAKEVFVIVRKGYLKATDREKISALEKNGKVRILFNTEVLSIGGNKEKIEYINVFDSKEKKHSKINLDGLFLAIGSKPNSKIFQNKLDLDEKGYIKVDDKNQTSIKGVYAVGDIVDPVYKQAITAAGAGAKAAISAQKDLEQYKNVPVLKILPSETTASIKDIENKKQFDEEISKSTVPVIVDFYASWCGPCKKLAPFLEAQAKILNGKVKILKVNVEKVRSLSSKYNVRTMPTVIVFDKNKNRLFEKRGPDNIAKFLNSLEKKKDLSIEEIDGYLKNLSN